MWSKQKAPGSPPAATPGVGPTGRGGGYLIATHLCRNLCGTICVHQTSCGWRAVASPSLPDRPSPAQGSPQGRAAALRPPGLGKAGAGGERVSSTAGLSPQRRAQRPRSSPFPPLELFGAVIALFLSAVLAESFLLARAPRRRPIAEGARGAPAIFGASCAAAAGRAGLSDPAA